MPPQGHRKCESPEDTTLLGQVPLVLAALEKRYGGRWPSLTAWGLVHDPSVCCLSIYIFTVAGLGCRDVVKSCSWEAMPHLQAVIAVEACFLRLEDAVEPEAPKIPKTPLSTKLPKS